VCVVVEGAGCKVLCTLVHRGILDYRADTTVKKRLLRRGYLTAGAVCPALDTLHVHIFEVVSTNTLMR
jgi:hypothetical protein